MKANLTIGIPVWLDRVFTWPVLVYRRRKYGWPFRRVYLGDGEFTIVDPDVYYRLGHYNWFYRSGRNGKLYAARYSKTENGRTKQVSLHREIINPPDGLIVDHLNGKSLDNRIANLRPATYSQNAQNVPKKKNTSSRFIGVCYHKSKKKWEAYITVQRKRIYLGHFENEIDAGRAYDTAARKYYGPDAKVNFPERSEGPREVTPLAFQQETLKPAPFPER